MFLKTCLEKGVGEKKQEMKFLPGAALSPREGQTLRSSCREPTRRAGAGCAGSALCSRGAPAEEHSKTRLAPAPSPQEGPGPAPPAARKH